MRFATLIHDDGATTAAVIDGEHLYPVPDTATVLDLVHRGLTDALEAGTRALAAARKVPLATAHLGVPLRPPTIRDFVSFADHVEGVRAGVEGKTNVPQAWYDAPHFYFTNPYSVSGPAAAIAAPHGSVELDFELEVAAIVGTAGTDLSIADAPAHIFGYTILNDWSARDLQRREMQVGLGPAKGKDFASTLGPHVVTADELAPFHDADGFLTLECVAQINGMEVGRDVLTNMGWTFPALLAYASRNAAIRPGDVLGSGTVGNGGCLAELWGRRGRHDPPALQPGDTVSLSVERLGTLVNTVRVRDGHAAPLPPARYRDRAAERARYTATEARA
jgi:2-keto-4-pentenoate hydratase/2-oxohepta-3-ene-1,7-dioic acid hydratase in catechol pathway